MSLDLSPSDTRVFLFHSPEAAQDASGAMDAVNSWLGKDRSGSPYHNLRVRQVAVAPDGQGGIYTTVVCTLGRISSGAVYTGGQRDQLIEDAE